MSLTAALNIVDPQSPLKVSKKVLEHTKDGQVVPLENFSLFIGQGLVIKKLSVGYHRRSLALMTSRAFNVFILRRAITAATLEVKYGDSG